MKTPSLLGLLAGPLRGSPVGDGIQGVSARLAVGVSVLLIFVLALLLGVLQLHRLAAKIDAIESSALSLMPRVALRAGRAHAEGAPGRVIETERVVVLFDTSQQAPEIPRAYGADKRPRVVVRSDALLLFTAERTAPLALPFSKVHAAVGDVTVDGPDLVRALRHFVPRMVLTLGGLAALAALVWQLVLGALLVTAYRLILQRGVALASFSELYAVSLLAGNPALVVGALILGISGRQDLAVSAHALVTGGLFLFGAGRRGAGFARDGGAIAHGEAPRVVTEL